MERSLKTAAQACYFYSWNKKSNKQNNKKTTTLSYVGEVTGTLHKEYYMSLKRGQVNFILAFWLSMVLGFARLVLRVSARIELNVHSFKLKNLDAKSKV